VALDELWSALIAIGKKVDVTPVDVRSKAGAVSALVLRHRLMIVRRVGTER